MSESGCKFTEIFYSVCTMPTQWENWTSSTNTSAACSVAIPPMGASPAGHLRGIPHHQRFLVMLYDLHSKWPEVVPTGTVTTQVITDILETLCARWGMPRAITTDNGPQFVFADFSRFLSDRGIKHIRTAYYNPQANRGVERFNQSLKNGIRAHLTQGCAFQTALNQTLMHYRASQHTTTGTSPASLMLGREMELPLDRLKVQGMVAPAEDNTQDKLKASVNRHQQNMQRYFDRKHRVKSTDIRTGDWVSSQAPPEQQDGFILDSTFPSATSAGIIYIPT